MSPQTPHARLLNLAAREVLEPLGLEQCGRSRTWVDDHGWWLVLVEFQPASFSRGSYLNVGAMWLWSEKDHFSFDVGYRIEGFTTFRNKSQFEREALRLAERAAGQVAAYRTMFPHVGAVAGHLAGHGDPHNPWSLYHAGVACGVAGRAADAARLLGQLLDQPARVGGDEALRAAARRFLTLAADQARFCLAAEQFVLAARQALRLRPVPVSFEEAGESEE